MLVKHVLHPSNVLHPRFGASSMSAVSSTEGDPTPATTIVVADKLMIVRGAVTRLLDNEPGVVVVAEALDVPMAVRKVLAYKPCVVVLDLHLSGGSALAAIPKMQHVSPRTRIVVLTSQCVQSVGTFCLGGDGGMR
jgi:ActR/RegA family two-component response regulator